jgi:phenylalanyl-tRNA synthetase beta chain
MPTLAVAKKFLFDLIGKSYTKDEFDELCFEFGVELDDVTSEREIFAREHANLAKNLSAADQKAFEAKLLALSDEELYKIDTPANRYDLLCAEGMAIALKVFKRMMPTPVIRAIPPKCSMHVGKSVANVRDYVVCAVLRNVKFTQERYDSFIDFQEKLHSGLARKRTLASVGTHDLDKCTPPFRYDAKAKETIRFTPLNQGSRVLDCTGDGLEQFYKDDKHISRYVPLISGFPKFPVVSDSTGTTLSLPPIINSDFSRIDVATRNIFIECTALDHHKAHVLVNQMVSAFSLYCDEPFTVEQVDVVYEEPITVLGKTMKEERTPNLSYQAFEVDVPTINSRVGVEVSADEVADLLTKMQYETQVLNATRVLAKAPPCRADVLHQCDIVEDVAIAYGYDNLTLLPCPTASHGTQTPMNKLTHLLRLELASAGYTEMLTFSLCSRDEAFDWLGRKDQDVAVHIGNPQTIEFQVVRPSLLPGTLKTLQHNKSSPLPLKLFEITDVVLLEPSDRIGSVNKRHLCAVHVEPDSSAFQDIQGVVEYVFVKLGVPKSSKKQQLSDENRWYYIESQNPADDGAFFAPLASHRIVLCHRKGESVVETPIGVLGVIHPNTLSKFDYPFPCSYCEIDLEPFRDS